VAAGATSRFGRLARVGGDEPARPLSEINMTPLIDVMLVLLVIFIVTAPLLASRLQLDLPQADGAQPGAPAAVLAVAIDRSGQVFVDEQPLPAERLRDSLQAAARAALARDPATELQLRADRAVPYGRVAELIGWAQAAGLVRIGLVAEPEPTPPPK